MDQNKESVEIALIQMDASVGDIAGNKQKILDACQLHRTADIVVTPELSVCGYPPEDLIFHERFLQDCEQAVAEIAEALKSCPHQYVLVGHPEVFDHKIYNVVSVLKDGGRIAVYRKHQLPNYGVFDERRYFTAQEPVESAVFTVGGVKFGINICEDIWHEEAPLKARESGAQILLIPNASPYEYGKLSMRFRKIAENVNRLGMDAVYVNMAGAQDEIVFDGCSFARNVKGEQMVMPSFQSGCCSVLVRDGHLELPEGGHREESIADLYDALVLSLKRYVELNYFKGIVLGLSGGVDSALVLKIAVDAIGAEKVQAVMMPSRYTSDMSLEDAEALAKRLKVKYDIIPIMPAYLAFEAMLSEQFEGYPQDVTEENLQARIRGMLLMAISNKKGLLVATTGNKSETAVGYSTLYGDLAGGFAVIKDVYKTQVYELCRWINSREDVFPENILTRAPSAELRENQKDQDSLPDYGVLDGILRLYLEEKLSVDEIVRKGYSRSETERTVGLIRRAEYKRRQSPIGPKISSVAFGRDWRYPIVNKYRG